MVSLHTQEETLQVIDRFWTAFKSYALQGTNKYSWESQTSPWKRWASPTWRVGKLQKAPDKTAAAQEKLISKINSLKPTIKIVSDDAARGCNNNSVERFYLLRRRFKVSLKGWCNNGLYLALGPMSGLDEDIQKQQDSASLAKSKFPKARSPGSLSNNKVQDTTFHADDSTKQQWVS